MMSGKGENPVFFNKKINIRRSEHPLTPPPPTSKTSHFCLIPPPTPLKVGVIFVSPLRKIVEYLRKNLPQIHAVTGFGTTSFLHVVGKIKVLKKCLDGKKTLNRTGVSCQVSETAVKDASLFKLFAILKKKKRFLTKTMVRLYKQMKTKTSQSLPPDK